MDRFKVEFIDMSTHKVFGKIALQARNRNDAITKASRELKLPSNWRVHLKPFAGYETPGHPGRPSLW